MSTAAVSASPLSSGVQSFIEQRDAGLKQLGKALQAGDLATAQLAFQAIQSLSQNNSAANGNSFKVAGRQQDFAAIGQTLQSGDLAGAQQALVQLRKSVQPQRNVDPPPATVVNLGGPSSGTSAAPSSTGSQSAATSSTGSANGTEIVLNLGNVTPGEQITIGVSNPGNGTEQVTIGVANQQNQSAEQITLNLNQNSNQQIILNLFNSTVSSAAQGGGVSVTA